MQTHKKGIPGFVLSSSDLHTWVGDLVAGGHSVEAIAVARFALSIDGSADSYDSLATAYLGEGKTSDAVATFEQALVTKPDDFVARSALTQIKSAKSDGSAH